MAIRPTRRYEGSCHCGAIRFAIRTGFPELTTCDCSICKRKNALMVRVHETKFELLRGQDSLSEYQFHTHTARHFFCTTCGIERNRYCCQYLAGVLVQSHSTDKLLP